MFQSFYVIELTFYWQMTYNAEGDMLLPFVPHKPREIPESVSKYFEKKINFFATDDGQMDPNSLCLMLLSMDM